METTVHLRTDLQAEPLFYDMTATIISETVLGVARAEKYLADYRSCVVSYEDTKRKLMMAFGLEDRDAEMVLQEVDAK